MGSIISLPSRKAGRHGRRSRRRWRGATLLLAVVAAVVGVLISSLPSPQLQEAAREIVRSLPWGSRIIDRLDTGNRRVRSATVVRGRAQVIDGDSLKVNGVNIRLHGIDAPESRQTCRDRSGRRYACGQRATEHMRQLVAGRVITCRKVTTDRYGRMVAICKRGKEDIGRRMVRDGWAVAFVRYSRHYVADEQAARSARRGLWQGRFITPEVWRRMQHRQR